jgi:hypothetical protein
MIWQDEHVVQQKYHKWKILNLQNITHPNDYDKINIVGGISSETEC